MTQLVRRNFPVSTFVDRFFDDSFFARPSRATNGDGATWVPAVDLSQSDEKFVLRADLPGLSKDDVNLTVEDSTLTLSGDRPLGKKEDGEAFNRVERTFGTFTRSFTLMLLEDSHELQQFTPHTMTYGDSAVDDGEGIQTFGTWSVVTEGVVVVRPTVAR